MTRDTALASNWNRWLSLLTLAALLVTPLAALGATALGGEPPRAHPALVDLAAARPDAPARVIVQKTTTDGSVETLIGQLGGVVLDHLQIINAVVARLPAWAVLVLARSAGVRWISPDGKVESAALTETTGTASAATLTWDRPNRYLDTLSMPQVWNMGLKGRGIGVAIVDSGISTDADFSSPGMTALGSRVVKVMRFNPNSRTVNDVYGHGTHAAGIIGGNGADSAGFYSGIAPEVNLIALKISDEQGMAYESDTVQALQWIYNARAAYNIRVVNLSINSTVEQSYHVSPLNAAAEILWFNGIVVVASAGNIGAGSAYSTIKAAPANDPFIITVGASNENGTTHPSDDVMAPYSAYGSTADGFAKPDIIAPGTSIYSVLSKDSPWATQYPDRVVNGQYFRLSGTSMAAPMVAGAVALLLQDEPTLTPDQVKYRLLTTASRTFSLGAREIPYLNVANAVTGTTTQPANTGVAVSALLTTGPEGVLASSVNWNSVNWNSVNWNSVNWNSVNWNSVAWQD